MFDPWCPTCRSRVLLTARRLRALVPTADGHRAVLTCWCGAAVAMDVARAASTRPAAPPSPADVAA